VLYIGTHSEQGLTPKTAHWPKPGQDYFRENASLGWCYLTDIKVIGKVMERHGTPLFHYSEGTPSHAVATHHKAMGGIYMCAL